MIHEHLPQVIVSSALTSVTLLVLDFRCILCSLHYMLLKLITMFLSPFGRSVFNLLAFSLDRLRFSVVCVHCPRPGDRWRSISKSTLLYISTSRRWVSWWSRPLVSRLFSFLIDYQLVAFLLHSWLAARVGWHRRAMQRLQEKKGEREGKKKNLKNYLKDNNLGCYHF